MNLPAHLLSAPWAWSAHLALALLLGYALATAPWRRLHPAHRLHAFLGACVAIILLWTLQTDLRPGMHLHYLGITTLTLMFGWRLALVGAALATLAVTVNGLGGWDAFSLNVLLSGACPALATYGVYRLSERFLPAHFFVYLYVCAALGGALAMAASLLAIASVLVLSGAYTPAQIYEGYVVSAPFLIVPEGVLNGMVMTGLVVYRPGWVWTFDDRRHLHGP